MKDWFRQDPSPPKHFAVLLPVEKVWKEGKEEAERRGLASTDNSRVCRIRCEHFYKYQKKCTVEHKDSLNVGFKG